MQISNIDYTGVGKEHLRIPCEKLAPGEAVGLVYADARVVGLHSVQRARSGQADLAARRREFGAWHVETVDGDELVKGQAIRSRDRLTSVAGLGSRAQKGSSERLISAYLDCVDRIYTTVCRRRSKCWGSR